MRNIKNNFYLNMSNNFIIPLLEVGQAIYN